MSTKTDDKIKDWERHISTVASAIVIALLAWMGSSTISMGQDITAIKVKLDAAVHIQSTLAEIQKEHAHLGASYGSLQDRIGRIEKEQEAEDARERIEHGGGV